VSASEPTSEVKPADPKAKPTPAAPQAVPRVTGDICYTACHYYSIPHSVFLLILSFIQS